MEMRKPKIKAFPYEEWKDNDTLRDMAEAILFGRSLSQLHVAVLNSCRWDAPDMTFRGSDLRLRETLLVRQTLLCVPEQSQIKWPPH